MLVIGLGHPDRGDDAAGHQAVSGIELDSKVLRRDCSDLLELIEDQDEVIIIDAMRSGAARGTIRRFSYPGDELPLKGFVSSHFFGLSETLTLAHTLDRLPGDVTIFGIEAGETSLGDPMSQEVTEAAQTVAETINRMVAA